VIITCPSCGARNRIPPARLGQQAHCGSCKTAISVREPHPLSTPDEFSELVSKSTLPVLVDFWAPWCGPCRVVAPEMEKLARERAGALVIAKVNTDDLPQVANQFGIRGIPTFILFKGGQEVGRASGAMSATQIASAVGFR
jgi:thioredoxin 2